MTEEGECCLHPVLPSDPQQVAMHFVLQHQESASPECVAEGVVALFAAAHRYRAVCPSLPYLLLKSRRSHGRILTGCLEGDEPLTMANISRLALYTAKGGAGGKHRLVEEVALLRAGHIACTAYSLVDTGGEEGAVNPVVVLKPAKTLCAVHPSTGLDEAAAAAAAAAALQQARQGACPSILCLNNPKSTWKSLCKKCRGRGAHGHFI
jgi:hypothetical protein